MTRAATSQRVQEEPLGSEMQQDPDQSRVELQADAEGIDAIPIAFGSEEHRCFGWFHRAASPTRDVGVVLCRPLGYEGNCAYETFTKLAERLSAAGFAVIRFDYHGTGDSSGTDADPERVRAWMESISAAIDEVQALAGVRRVSLFGVRAGATLAAEVASARGGVDSLVMWAPCVSGRLFTRELKMSSQVSRPGQEEESPKAGGDIEALGYLYTEATLKALSKLDLLKLSPAPSHRILVVGRDDLPDEGPLPSALRKAGAEVIYRVLPGYAAMMVEPNDTQVEHSTLREITEFLCEVHPVVHGQGRGPSRQGLPAQRAAVFEGVREVPLIFGTGPQLFGILAEPAEALAPTDPRSRVAVLMLNVGTNHRVGPNRMYVKMARAWARRGYRSLRFDLAGIGDSGAAAGYSKTRLYSRGSTVDVQAAMDALGARGTDRFILVGLCSGAYVGFQTALADPRIAGLILMNPRRLNWRDGDTLQSVMNQSYKSTHFYRRALLEPSTYLRLLKGKIDALGIARRVGSLALARARRASDRLLSKAPPEEDVLSNMRRLCERGTTALLIVGAEDDGLDYLEFHLGPRGRHLRSERNFEMVFIEGTDHTFSRGESQSLVIGTVVQHLDARFGARGA